ncbi:MAG: DUF5666 domain-containing protein [Chloroflexota bacterium]
MMADNHAHHDAHASNAAHGAHGGHGAHGLHGAGGGQGATGTITSISGTTFGLATTAGEITVATNAGTNFHTPGVAKEAKQAGYDGYRDLTFAALKVGQRVAVQGERQDDTTLVAERVHIPKP